VGAVTLLDVLHPWYHSIISKLLNHRTSNTYCSSDRLQYSLLACLSDYTLSLLCIEILLTHSTSLIYSSAGDPDPDPHDFGPPGYGFIKERCGSRIRLTHFTSYIIFKTENANNLYVPVCGRGGGWQSAGLRWRDGGGRAPPLHPAPPHSSGRSASCQGHPDPSRWLLVNYKKYVSLFIRVIQTVFLGSEQKQVRPSCKHLKKLK
jgi:hypothetical protein